MFRCQMQPLAHTIHKFEKNLFSIEQKKTHSVTLARLHQDIQKVADYYLYLDLCVVISKFKCTHSSNTKRAREREKEKFHLFSIQHFQNKLLLLFFHSYDVRGSPESHTICTIYILTKISQWSHKNESHKILLNFFFSFSFHTIQHTNLFLYSGIKNFF